MTRSVPVLVLLVTVSASAVAQSTAPDTVNEPRSGTPFPGSLTPPGSTTPHWIMALVHESGVRFRAGSSDWMDEVESPCRSQRAGHEQDAAVGGQPMRASHQGHSSPTSAQSVALGTSSRLCDRCQTAAGGYTACPRRRAACQLHCSLYVAWASSQPDPGASKPSGRGRRAP